MELGVDEAVYDYAQSIEKELKPRFEKMDAVAERNQLKVLKAMQKNKIAGSASFRYNGIWI